MGDQRHPRRENETKQHWGPLDRHGIGGQRTKDTPPSLHPKDPSQSLQSTDGGVERKN